MKVEPVFHAIQVMVNHAGGISLITFVIAVAISMGYYQFVYIPEANAKPVLPKEILEPEGELQITIVPGSALQSQTENFKPKQIRSTIGIDNKIIWTNNDSTPHTVTTDDEYVDIINGKFDSLATEVEFLTEGEAFEFTFTKVGEYPYHCEPHPWMKGMIQVVENFG